MKIYRSLSLLITMLLVAIGSFAQEVIVTVTPVQNVLPPQVLLYLSNPSKYFTITLTNKTDVQQDVYLTMNLEQTLPASGLCVITPSNIQPTKPFTIPASGFKTLTMTEMKTMFNHLPASSIQTSEGLFDDYQNGSFGLLPEGDYRVQITAYKWASPKLADPVVVSDPTSGQNTFKVCYKAQAPQMLMPIASGAGVEDNTVAPLSVLNAMFTWTVPIVACNPTVTGFTYNFKVVEVYDGQSPDDAMEHNPTIYKADQLLVPQCIIPTNVITKQMYANKVYAAQVTAKSTSSNTLNYTLIENSGKSTYRLFKIKVGDDDEEEESETAEEKNTDNDKDGDNDDDDDDDDDDNNGKLSFGDIELYGKIATDKDYTFKFPNILYPVFARGDEARKMFKDDDLNVTWIRSSFVGGEGQQPDTVKLAYDVQLFRGENPGDLQAALETEPIFSEQTKGDSLTIPWEKIKDVVETGNYMVLRVNPVVLNNASVAFRGDSTHIRDFALVESLTKKYFQCSNMVEITNTYPTKKKASDLKGKTIAIGQYQLTIDEIKEGKTENTWQGKGHVLWEPIGLKIHVCVKFDSLLINTDDVVYGGICTTYADDNIATDAEVVDKLFSDWGIDNLIADSSIPYASSISSTTSGYVKDIAKQINLSSYYEKVKKAEVLYDVLTTGEVKDCYMPIKLPESINKTPVDIQISTMKFAATYATMDLIGEFTLPNSDYLKDDILVFGAPRLCISPDRVLPESGTIALLSDFTITDPKSDFEMTFNAPENVLEPEDGCYISWHADELELLGIDIDMLIPGLVKDNNGVASTEHPTLNITTSIGSWEDWYASATIDPFQVEKLPGWTFTASNIIYDHSWSRNSAKMGAFPANYDRSAAGIAGMHYNEEDGQWYDEGEKQWEGLYIEKVAVEFPASIKIGSGDERMKISVENLLYDKSGLSVEASILNPVNLKTAKLGGWAFSVDTLGIRFLQSKFDQCYMSGKVGVPLLKNKEGEKVKIGYKCNMYDQRDENNKTTGNYAFIFKTQQTDDISFDFWLANAEITKDLTYFLVEANPKADGDYDTKIELVMGGEINISSSSLGKKIPLDIDIPDVHFVGMRLGTTETSWDSKDKETLAMQKAARDNSSLDMGSALLKYEGKSIELVKDKLYFNTGAWSLASLEKQLGPFKFTLKDWKIDTGTDDSGGTLLTLGVNGDIGLIDDIEISVGCDVELRALLGGVSTSGFDLDNLSLTYKDVNFKEIHSNASFAGCKFSFVLNIIKEDNTEYKGSKGYAGSVSLELPGDFIHAEAKGGFFTHTGDSDDDKFRWGYFEFDVGGAEGIPIPPVQLNDIYGGFYFNCRKSDYSMESTEKPEAHKDAIGIHAGLGIASLDGETLKGKFDMTVAIVKYTGSDGKKYSRLSTFMLNGNVDAVGGLISSKAQILYEHTDDDQYFQLNVTVDAKLDNVVENSEIGSAMKAATAELKQVQSKLEELNSAASEWANYQAEKVGLGDKIGDDSKQTDKNERKAPEVKEENKSASFTAGASISLNFKITKKENGVTYNNVKWHLYLGKPKEGERCTLTLLDFKAGSLVHAYIGADAYLCLGNELPDDGQLPEIPATIQNFLNGGNAKSAGVETGDLAKANRSRAAAMKQFAANAEVDGGVMLGAHVNGYIDVNLGLFYAYLGAEAGFDVSVTHTKQPVQCVGLGNRGWNNWYATGQLYAYLQAVLGLHIDLGFFEDDIDIINFGIGGVVSLGLPKPTWVEGNFRVKLSLLGGLVNVNKKFAFDAGEKCEVFAGNALDDFQMFGECSLGDTIKVTDENFDIPPILNQYPTFDTTVPIGEHYRVLDPTHAERMKQKDPEWDETQSNRTFVFDVDETAFLYTYNYDDTVMATPLKSYEIPLKNNELTRLTHILDLLSINSHTNYKLVYTGRAKELKNGELIDPEKYDTDKGKYIPTPWNREHAIYFRTKSLTYEEYIAEKYDIQKNVVLAYPSDENLIQSDIVINAHKADIEFPNIAFNKDFSQHYPTGKTTDTSHFNFTDHVNNVEKKFVWTLSEVGTDGKLTPIANKDGTYIGYKTSCNITMADNVGFSDIDISSNKTYNLSLDYYVITCDTTTTIKSAEQQKEDMIESYYSQTSMGKIEHQTNEIENQIKQSMPTVPFGIPGIVPTKRLSVDDVQSAISTTLSTKLPEESSSSTTASTISKSATSSATTSTSSSTTASTISKSATSSATTSTSSSTTASTISKSATSSATTSTSSATTALVGTLDTSNLSTSSGTIDATLSSSTGSMNLPWNDIEWKDDTTTVVTVKIDTIHFMNINVKVADTGYDWRYDEGCSSTYGDDGVTYDDAFIGVAVTDFDIKMPAVYTDREFGWHMADYGIFSNPYLYMSYLSNFAFIGGNTAEKSYATQMGINTPTTESLVYTNDAGNYEGTLVADGSAINVYNGMNELIKRTIFDPSQYEAFTEYPLPDVLLSDNYPKTLGRFNRIYPFVKPNKLDVSLMARNTICSLSQIVSACIATSKQIATNLCPINPSDCGNGGRSDWQEWLATHPGYDQVYSTNGNRYLYEKEYTELDENGKSKTAHATVYTEEGNTSVTVPYYQYPLLWGSNWDCNSRLAKTMGSPLSSYKPNRGELGLSNNIYFTLCNYPKNAHIDMPDECVGLYRLFTDTEAVKSSLKSVTLKIYRVNSYDYVNDVYTVIKYIATDKSPAVMENLIVTEPFKLVTY